MLKLDDLWQEWIVLFDTLNDSLTSSDRPIGTKKGEKLLSPFIPDLPQDYDFTFSRNVLYVGKAAAGDDGEIADLKEFDSCHTVETLRHFTSRFLASTIYAEPKKYPSPFWQFARNLTIATKENSKDAFHNLVWSNACKIGALGHNPSHRLLTAQRDLAVRTLRTEIAAYKPRLIVFVTNHDAQAIIRDLVSDNSDSSWEKVSGSLKLRDWIWWRDKTDALPAMLWTRHPQGAPKAWSEACLKLVKDFFDKEKRNV